MKLWVTPWTDSWLQVCAVSDPKFFLFDLNQEKRFTIREKPTLLVFGIIDCSGDQSSAYSVDLEYELLSTGFGDQLSLGEKLVPFKQFTYQALWGLGLLLWLIYLFLHWNKVVPLHWVLAVVIMLRLAICSVETSYWWIYHQEGIRMSFLMKIADCVFALSETGFFVLLYLLSKGWRIVRPGVPTDGVRTVFVGLAVVLAALLFFSGYNIEYYWLTLLVMYFFILPKVFTSLTEMMSTLEGQIRILSQFPNLATLAQDLRTKKVTLASIRSIIVSYFIAVLLINCLIKMLISWTYTWVVVAINDLVSYIMYASFCYFLRPRNGLFFLSVDDVTAYTALNLLNVTNEPTEEIDPWDLTKTMIIQWPGRRSKNFSIAYEEAYLKESFRKEKEGTDSEESNL